MAFLVGLDGLLAVIHGLGVAAGALLVGLAVVGIGVLQFVVAYSLWQLEPYAYSWGMGLFAVGLAADLLTGNVHGAGLTGVNMIVLYHYRGLFRR